MAAAASEEDVSRLSNWQQSFKLVNGRSPNTHCDKVRSIRKTRKEMFQADYHDAPDRIKRHYFAVHKLKTLRKTCATDKHVADSGSSSSTGAKKRSAASSMVSSHLLPKPKRRKLTPSSHHVSEGEATAAGSSSSSNSLAVLERPLPESSPVKQVLAACQVPDSPASPACALNMQPMLRRSPRKKLWPTGPDGANESPQKLAHLMHARQQCVTEQRSSAFRGIVDRLQADCTERDALLDFFNPADEEADENADDCSGEWQDETLCAAPAPEPENELTELNKPKTKPRKKTAVAPKQNYVKVNLRKKQYSRAPRPMTGAQYKRMQHKKYNNKMRKIS